MEPIVNGLETEFEADVTFDRINASSERGQAAMRAYSLRGHPSYVLLDEQGEEVWQFSGQTAEVQLRSQLTALGP
jgi:hypothetical protein